MASPRFTPAESALRRAARSFRCRTCRAAVRAKWEPNYSRRSVEDHGTDTVKCPGSGRVVEESGHELQVALCAIAGFHLDPVSCMRRFINVLAERGRYALVHEAGMGYALRHETPGGLHHRRFHREERDGWMAWIGLWRGPLCAECAHPGFGDPLRPSGLCSRCQHWSDELKCRDERTVIVGGYCYRIGESEASIARRCGFRIEAGRLTDARHVLGHGGAEFIVQFRDGRDETTTNLWCAGRIPAWFRTADRLPDNAVFGKREHSHAYVGAGSASL